MSEYIRREDALKGQKTGTFANGICLEAKACVPVDYIESLEPADVVPVVHAHWIPQRENYEFKEVWMKCSACGYPVSKWTGNTNFCPNCGADMRGKQNE